MKFLFLFLSAAAWAATPSKAPASGGARTALVVGSAMGIQAATALRSTQFSEKSVCSSKGLLDPKASSSCQRDLGRWMGQQLSCTFATDARSIAACNRAGGSCAKAMGQEIYNGTIGSLTGIGDLLWEAPGMLWKAPGQIAKGVVGATQAAVKGTMQFGAAIQKNGLGAVANAASVAQKWSVQQSQKVMEVGNAIAGALWTSATCLKMEKGRCVQPQCPSCASAATFSCAALGFVASAITMDVALALLTEGATAEAHLAALTGRVNKMMSTARASGRFQGLKPVAKSVIDWGVKAEKARHKTGDAIGALPGAKAAGKAVAGAAKVVAKPLKVTLGVYEDHVVQPLASSLRRGVRGAAQNLRIIPGTEVIALGDDLASGLFKVKPIAWNPGSPGSRPNPLNILAHVSNEKGLEELRFLKKGSVAPASGDGVLYFTHDELVKIQRDFDDNPKAWLQRVEKIEAKSCSPTRLRDLRLVVPGRHSQ